jgi:hypothetical protein
VRKKLEVAGAALEASAKKSGMTVVKVNGVRVDEFAFDFGDAFRYAAEKFPPPPKGKQVNIFGWSWAPPANPVHTCAPPTTVTVPVCAYCLVRPGLNVVNAALTCAGCWRAGRGDYDGWMVVSGSKAVREVMDKVDLGLFAMPLRLRLRSYFTEHSCDDVHVSAEMLVPDREDPTRWLSLGVSWRLADYPDPSDEAAFLAALRDQLRWLVHHELDESVVHAGRRPFDPHVLPMEEDGYRRSPKKKAA